MTAKEFLQQQLVMADTLDSVLIGGRTTAGNYVLGTPPEMNIKTLMKVREMLDELIEEMVTDREIQEHRRRIVYGNITETD